jgi:hypothetical protein
MRWPWKVCLALAVGAVVNVVVAWGFAVRADRAIAGYWLPGQGPPEDIRVAIPPEMLVPPDGITRVQVGVNYFELRGRCVQEVECHIAEYARQGGPATRFVNATRLRAGWPLWSFEGVGAGAPDGLGSASFVRGYLRAPRWMCPVVQSPAGPATRVEYIPTGPMPMGFAADSGLFAAAFFAVVFAPRIVRRHIRVRGGRCVRCGYDQRGLNGDTCPECGALSISK